LPRRQSGDEPARLNTALAAQVDPKPPWLTIVTEDIWRIVAFDRATRWGAHVGGSSYRHLPRELTLEASQHSVNHLRMRVRHSAPDDLAPAIQNAHRRSLATHVQSCIHFHRCCPFVGQRITCGRVTPPPGSSNLMYGMYYPAPSGRPYFACTDLR
jgi:hypothetical protein